MTTGKVERRSPRPGVLEMFFPPETLSGQEEMTISVTCQALVLQLRKGRGGKESAETRRVLSAFARGIFHPLREPR